MNSNKNQEQQDDSQISNDSPETGEIENPKLEEKDHSSESVDENEREGGRSLGEQQAAENDNDRIIGYRRKSFILSSYLIGLISLDIALFGFCFWCFWIAIRLDKNIYSLIGVHYSWVWILAIVFAIIFLSDMVLVLALKHKNKIGSLKNLRCKKFFIPLVCSTTACGLIGLICGGCYFIYLNNEATYIQNDVAIHAPISQPLNILGAAYNQCYEPANSTGYSYYIDDYEYSINGVGDLGSTQISVGEFGCLLNALNIDKTNSGTSVLTTMLQSVKNSSDMMNSVKIGPYHLFLSIVYTNGELVGTTFAISGTHISGYKFDTSDFPAMNTINSSANFMNSVGPALSAVSDVFTPNADSSELDGDESSDSSNSASNSEGNTNSSNQSSNSSDAASDIASAWMCGEDGGSNNISSNSQTTGGNPTSITVYGTTEWGSILNCVAGGTAMPSSVQKSLKAFISRDVSALNGGSPIKNPISNSTNWTLGDGSSIYLTYGGPNNGDGGWSATFSTTNPNNN